MHPFGRCLGRGDCGPQLGRQPGCFEQDEDHGQQDEKGIGEHAAESRHQVSRHPQDARGIDIGLQGFARGVQADAVEPSRKVVDEQLEAILVLREAGPETVKRPRDQDREYAAETGDRQDDQQHRGPVRHPPTAQRAQWRCCDHGDKDGEQKGRDQGRRRPHPGDNDNEGRCGDQDAGGGAEERNGAHAPRYRATRCVPGAANRGRPECSHQVLVAASHRQTCRSVICLTTWASSNR